MIIQTFLKYEMIVVNSNIVYPVSFALQYELIESIVQF